jgi:nucleotide-binding universal stress UspA family protein
VISKILVAMDGSESSLKAYLKLLHLADEVNVDTIIVGSKGVKSIKEFLLGVSDKVAHHAKCPVTIVR